MDFEKILWLSTLIFFNTFCILGIFLMIYLIFLASRISRLAENLTDFAKEKLDSLEEGFTDWSWLIVPIMSIFGGGLTLGKKKARGGGIKRIIRDLLK